MNPNELQGMVRCTVCGKWGMAAEMMPVRTRIGNVFPTQTTRWFHEECVA